MNFEDYLDMLRKHAEDEKKRKKVEQDDFKR